MFDTGLSLCFKKLTMTVTRDRNDPQFPTYQHCIYTRYLHECLGGHSCIEGCDLVPPCKALLVPVFKILSLCKIYVICFQGNRVSRNVTDGVHGEHK